MKNILRITFAFAAALLLFSSCRKQATLEVGAQSIDAPSSGLTQAVSVNANYPWDAVVSDSWIILHNTTGNPGDAVIGVCVMNNTSGEDREGTITVTCEDIVRVITVRQSQNDALSIDDDAVSLTYVGGEVIVPVEANIQYAVDIPVDWITDGGTRAITSYQHALTVAMNESEEDREAVVCFTNPSTGEKRTYYVKQAGFSPTVVITHTITEFTVPELVGSEGFYATVTWGDGTSEEYYSGLSHIYPVEGEYNVVIIGKGLTGYKMPAIEGINSIDITEF